MPSSPQPKRWKGDRDCEDEDGPGEYLQGKQTTKNGSFSAVPNGSEIGLNIDEGQNSAVTPAKIPFENSLIRRCLEEFESGDEMDYPKVYTPVAGDVNGYPDASSTVPQRSGRDRLRYCLHASFQPNQEIDSSPERYKGTEWRGFLGRTPNRENEYVVAFAQEPRDIKPSTFWK